MNRPAETSGGGRAASSAGSLGLGPLVVEDCLAPLRMPKMDAFESGAFVAAFAVRLDRDEGTSIGTAEEQANLRAVEVALVAGDDYLVTVRDGPVREAEEALERWSPGWAGAAASVSPTPRSTPW